MILGRLLMRFLLVPLGGAIAIAVAMLVALVAEWNRFTPAATNNPDDLFGFVLIGSTLAFAMAYMLMPAMLGAMIAEAFAFRSLLYHAINGGLSAGVSLAMIGAFDKTYDLSGEPLIAVGAGIAAGFAYWVVAGWSAGFWKPVFAPARDPAAGPGPALPPR